MATTCDLAFGNIVLNWLHVEDRRRRVPFECEGTNAEFSTINIK